MIAESKGGDVAKKADTKKNAAGKAKGKAPAKPAKKGSAKKPAAAPPELLPGEKVDFKSPPPPAAPSAEKVAEEAKAVLLKIPPPDARLVKLSELKAWDKNPRVIPQKAVDKLIATIKGVGKWGAPLLIQKGSNRIIAGHTRIKAAEQMGLDEVPCMFIDCTDEEADILAVADNRLGQETEWDFEALAGVLKGMGDEASRLLTGFDAHEIEPLLAADWTPPTIGPLPGEGGSGADGEGAVEPIELTREERATFAAAVEWARKLWGEDLTEGEIVARLSERFTADCEADEEVTPPNVPAEAQDTRAAEAAEM
jgi:ParB-like chromosome segregation protein Spo0J